MDIFELKIEADRNTTGVGGIINFDITITIEDSDGRLPLEDLTFILDGPITRSCSFDASGNILSGCAGVDSISRLDDTPFSFGYSPDFGYGYGYGPSSAELRYKISIDTTGFPVGTYTTELRVTIGDATFSQSGEDLTIRPPLILGRESSGEVLSGTTAKETRFISVGKLSVTPGAVFSFLLDGSSHKLVVNEIRQDIVDITIFSEPKNINVGIIDVVDVDLDGDGEKDLSIDVQFIGKNKASLIINSDKPIVFEQERSEKRNVINLESTKFSGVSSQVYDRNKNLLSNPFFLISIIILNLILMESIAIVSASRKRQ